MWIIKHHIFFNKGADTSFDKYIECEYLLRYHNFKGDIFDILDKFWMHFLLIKDNSHYQSVSLRLHISYFKYE